jgi:hypothetical protein
MFVPTNRSGAIELGFLKNMKDAQAQAQEAMGANHPGAVQQAMGSDQEAQIAYAQLAMKLQQSGVEAQGVIHAIRPTGEVDVGGGQWTDFEVSIRPPEGDPFQTTIRQSMLAAQLEEMSEGGAITVKYDPDSPTSAMIYGW